MSRRTTKSRTNGHRLERRVRGVLARVAMGAAVSLAAGATGAVAATTGAGASAPHLSASVSYLNFLGTTLGTYTGPDTFTLTNDTASTDKIDLFTADLTLSGQGADDFIVLPGPNCTGNGISTVVLGAGASCELDVYFFPGSLGPRDATMTIRGSADAGSAGVSIDLQGSGTIGYYQVTSSGTIASFGDAGFYGDLSNVPLNSPIVGIAQTGDNGGYWLVASDGGIFSFGDAGFHGSAGSLPLNRPIVGMASTPDGGGYWLVASDGGIFAYGDAGFFGSTGALHLNKPIVGMASTPDGRGYWMVASDGGIFSFGDAGFFGSTGADSLVQPINGMAAMPTGLGYWFSAADGGIFTFGDATFEGSSGGRNLGAPIVAMTTDGNPTLQAMSDIPAIRQGHTQGTDPMRVLSGMRRDARS